MKRYISMAIIAAVIPSICMGYSAKYNRLVSEKQRKMAELEECSGNVNGWKIAGISTLGLTAVGVVGNVALANKSKDYDKKIEKTEKSIESYDQKITAQKQEKMRQAEEEANKSACEQSDGTWKNGECTCPQEKPLKGNRCEEPAATTTSATAAATTPATAATPTVPAGTDCTADAKAKDANVASATIDESGKCVVQTCSGDKFEVDKENNKCVEKTVTQKEEKKPDNKKPSEKKNSSAGSGGSAQATSTEKNIYTRNMSLPDRSKGTATCSDKLCECSTSAKGKFDKKEYGDFDSCKNNCASYCLASPVVQTAIKNLSYTDKWRIDGGDGKTYSGSATCNNSKCSCSYLNMNAFDTHNYDNHSQCKSDCANLCSSSASHKVVDVKKQVAQSVQMQNTLRNICSSAGGKIGKKLSTNEAWCNFDDSCPSNKITELNNLAKQSGFNSVSVESKCTNTGSVCYYHHECVVAIK